MIPELLLLLLPIAAASGWIAARRHYLLETSRNNGGYQRIDQHAALVRLLEEDPERSGDHLPALSSSETDAVELYLAVGNLFRRYGEVEKAIEVHQQLIASLADDPQRRAQATFELGVDYQRAGLYDRAEALFQELIDSETHRAAALRELLQIAQQTKDWHKAIELTGTLARMGKVPKGESVAHFLCQLAEECRNCGRLYQAMDYVTQALRSDPGCVRASLLRAQLESLAGNHAAAFSTLRRVEGQEPAFLPEILAPIRACGSEGGGSRDEVEGYLHYLYFRYGLPEAAVLLTEMIAAREGPGRALEFITQAVERKPTLKGLHAMLQLQAQAGGPEERTVVNHLETLLGQILARKSPYRCKQCGFTCTELHWRCPSCNHWGTIRPESHC